MGRRAVENIKFIIGIIILTAMIIMHEFVRAFTGHELALFLFPAHLIGMDINKIIKSIKGTK